MRRCTAAWGLAAALLVFGLGTSRAAAADLGVYSAPAEAPVGVSCESPESKAFDSVWMGHFTGGYSHYLGDGLPVVLDWRDDTLCFPTRHSCDRYMKVMRRDFHNPEGYFTCLPIR